MKKIQNKRKSKLSWSKMKESKKENGTNNDANNEGKNIRMLAISWRKMIKILQLISAKRSLGVPANNGR